MSVDQIWTLSIPFRTARRGNLGMVKIGKDIWIISECNVFVFNTELQQLFKVEVVFPQISFIVAVVAHVDKIYFWVDGGIIGHSLYQLDTNTKQVEFVIKAERLNGLPKSSTILGNFMYFMENNFMTESLLLHKIDLVGKRMMETRVLKTTENNILPLQYALSYTDNNLYLLESDKYEKVRTVFKVGEDELEKLHEEVYRGIVDFERFDLFLICDIKDKDGPVYYLDSFDFKLNKWIRQKCEYQTNWIRSVLKMDDIVYTIVASDKISDGYEIRMLERLPSLEKRCILNVIDEIIKSEDFSQVDEFKKLLPPMLKQTANRMIHWKIEEHEHLVKMAKKLQALREAKEAQNGNTDASQ